MIIRIENARLAFHSLFEAKEQMNGQLKFEGNFILPEGVKTCKVKNENGEWVTRKINDVILEVATASGKFGKNPKGIVDGLESGRLFFRDGNRNTNKDGDVYEGYEGCFYAVGKSKARPDVVDRKRNKLSEKDQVVYNGCYGNVSLDIYAVAGVKSGGHGVFADLRAFQFTKDGEAFSGRVAVDADNEFDDLGDTGEDEDLA